MKGDKVAFNKALVGAKIVKIGELICKVAMKVVAGSYEGLLFE